MNSLTIFTAIVFIVAQVQVAESCNSYQWVFLRTIYPEPSFWIDEYTLKEYKMGQWVDSKFQDRKSHEIPGGTIPDKWDRQIGKVMLSDYHRFELSYWGKWPQTLFNIQVVSDMKNLEDPTFVDKAKDAMKHGILKIIQDFTLTCGKFKEPKVSLIQKIKAELLDL